jgi:phage shock protein E
VTVTAPTLASASAVTRRRWRRLAALAALGPLAAGALSSCAAGGTQAEAQVAAPGAATAEAPTPAGGLRTVPVEQFAAAIAALPAPRLLDVRTPEEFASGHLAGAENLDFNARASFEAQLAALDRNAPYAIYCRSDNRSGQALEMMRGLGFTDVVDLAGGIIAWQAAGRPVTG